MKANIAVAVLALVSFSASANEGIRAQMFNEFRNIESTSHKERIAILQQAESCIQAATNRDQYRTCEQQEKAAREQSNERTKASRQALRARLDGLRQSH